MRSIKTEKELIAQVRLGDTKAFQQLYEKYADAMYNICLRMMQSPDEAKDCLQESFIKAFRKIERLKDNASFPSWMKRITINTCLDELKKRIIFDDIKDDQFEDESEIEFEPYTSERIMSAIDGLPKGCRLVVILFCFEGKKHKEIAEDLGISISTSKSQLNRAKALLRDNLKAVQNEEFKKLHIIQQRAV